jgi:hypothetical protein
VRDFLRYRTKQSGFDPDRPLRSEPVRREEVRFEFEYQGQGRDRARVYVLWTMPLGTFRREERTGTYSYSGRSYVDSWLVADADLWQPVLDEVALELAADFAQFLRYYEENPALWSEPGERKLQSLEFRENDVREYTCDHCGCGYVGPKLRGNQRICVCSNRCAQDRDKALRRKWHEDHPDYARINAKRTAQRATARAGRTCEHCGKPIEAERSTRRFCSDICRVRWHRANSAPAPNQAGQ